MPVRQAVLRRWKAIAARGLTGSGHSPGPFGHLIWCVRLPHLVRSANDVRRMADKAHKTRRGMGTHTEDASSSGFLVDALVVCRNDEFSRLKGVVPGINTYGRCMTCLSKLVVSQ
jgi:hypothetical protein